MAEEELLKQILAKLDNLDSDMASLRNTMATKEDLEALNTSIRDNVLGRCG